MKRINPVLAFGTALLLFTACTSAPESDEATTTEAKEVGAASGATLKVDTIASKIEWVGTKVTAHHSGMVNIKNGELTLKDGTITGGNFVMDMTSLNVTGPKSSDAESNGKLQGHLRSADFFDVAAHPEASFAITSVEPFTGTVSDSTDARQETISKYKVASPTHTVSGNLTIKGVTKNISFPAQITVADDNIDAIAKFNINRKDWGIVYPGKPDDLIRDDIHLGIALKAAK